MPPMPVSKSAAARLESAGDGREAGLEIGVEDEGPGLSNTSNLFVPFFTTKQGGSGSAWYCAGKSPKRTAAR
jgi:C4-dicarboxylate-specific signal transduction histidine kinase